ncbi:hypothetical protein OPW36_15670 [Vibrio europaeus]|uniref:Uncharacterized protein n=1 Tax=Vibrio europaeus TaxID=300876 RepID=A0AAE7DY13_9VIBR|nr:hypothetical protein [Vibrio europaeus]MDC5805769.1 hypothetical protein [Vibrio europaeus]MDC5812066.1 hypothetical protein [Vibrio europaeus]MDC5826157.1 hypothetical protein [Vibrio europaeus]MDC5831522.1 hypothetical protein [Vibrio europaeus]MDC5834477.1 hypothetical protein [Vibrio europaeus]
MNNTLSVGSYTQEHNQGKIAVKFEWKEVATMIGMFAFAAVTVVLTGLSWAA